MTPDIRKPVIDESHPQGLRADLLLVEGDVATHISTVAPVLGVWRHQGREVAGRLPEAPAPAPSP